jgi:hypothetical protein
MHSSHRHIVLSIALLAFFLPLASTGSAGVSLDANDFPSGRLTDASLRVELTAEGQILLTWEPSCLASDTDYGIYRGSLHEYYTHDWLSCSTGGATTLPFPPGLQDDYYLVVPRNETLEGSYGLDGSGTERPPGVAACLTQTISVCPISAALIDIDSGQTSPTGNYRWMDVADQLYATGYRESYDYTQAVVELQYFTGDPTFHGFLVAHNLKPHFAYQVKLTGTAGTASNEAIGLTGRWWQEEWNGSEWANGQNLNNKGDGSSPNPNDTTYFARRVIADPTSPTGLRYKFTGYLVFNYFITDQQGDAFVALEQTSSFHVIWKSSQRMQVSGDGPLKEATFDVQLPDPVSAYDLEYPEATTSIYGEWERLPAGGVQLPAGDYDAGFILTEESFHGGGLAGGWAAAMGTNITFRISSGADGTRQN